MTTRETCSQCAKHWKPDPVAAGGIGTCELDIQRSTVLVVGNPENAEFHHQELLPYPGQVACSEFEK